MRITIAIFAALVLTCFGKPISSSVGARHVFAAGAHEKTYTAADYVQDGLVCMWDAVENAGWGQHVDHSSEWLDLINGFYLQTGGDAIGDFSNGYMDRSATFWNGEGNPLNPTGVRYYDKMIDIKSYINKGLFTVELIHRPHTKGLNSWQIANCGVQMFGLSGSHTALKIDANGTVETHSGIFQTGTSFSSSPFIDMEMESRSCLFDVANGVVTVMKNGEFDSNSALNNSTYWGGAADRPLLFINTCIGFVDYGIPNNWDSSQQGVSDIYCFRIYGRVLTEDEIAYNHMIDQARFGL